MFRFNAILIIILVSIPASIFSETELGGNEQFFINRGYSHSMVLNVTSSEIPNGFYLGQNFPNPFNPVTNIYFSIPKNQNIKISVTDILGKEIGVIVNGYTAAGSYKAYFDASGLSSGIYFYKLEASEFSEVKKMTLVK